MKTITLLLILLVTTVSAQINPEPLAEKIDLNLDKFHKQYRTGTIFTVIGGALAMAGMASVAQEQPQPAILFTGSIMLSVGGIIHIDAHKYLSKNRRI